MSNKFFKIILTLVGCAVIYAISISQIKNAEIFLDKKVTELKEQCAILENESASLLDKIQKLVSIQNLNKIAAEKNLKKPTEEQTVELTNDKIKKS